MARKALQPINLNIKLELTAGMPRTRPSMSKHLKAMAGQSASTASGLNSPMTSLTINLSELSTGRGTPKRRLSLSSVDTPPSENSEVASSVESGVFVDSPTLIDSPTLESLHAHRYRPNLPIEAFTKRKTISFRRINSMPPPALRLDCDSPTEFLESESAASNCDDSSSCSSETSSTSGSLFKPSFFLEECSSQDSGVSLPFKMPGPVIPKRKGSKQLGDVCEDTCSPLKYSPVKSPKKRSLSFSINSLDSAASDESPPKLKRSSLTSCEGDDLDDDGFLDIADFEVSEICDQVPASISSLFSEPLINRPDMKADDSTPVSRRMLPAKRFLQRSQSVDMQARQFKRPDSSQEDVQNKRWKSEQCHDDLTQCMTVKRLPARRLQRCHSETEAMIKSAVSRMSEEPDLIGDCSKPFILPTCRGKHQDLKSITPETLARLMQGEFVDHVECFHVIDCRYPYEFSGGHIKDAKNVFTRDAVLEDYLKNPRKAQDVNKRFILIFHCEFSSERGPNLFRFLRSQDRESNKECYPFLHYPEIYLLEGGYKAFFEEYKELCEPQTYKQMLHKDHSDDLRHFRAKSKSWAGEKKSQSYWT